MIKTCNRCGATFETDFSGRVHCDDCQKKVPREFHNNDDIVTNEQGGSQSRLGFDFTQLDADMLMRVARVLHQGAQKYGEKNWQKIPYKDHLNHMIYHAIMANTNDTSEDHLANVICRSMFAMWSKNNEALSRLEHSMYSPGIKKALAGELFPPIVSGLTQAELDQALGSKPPFGYRKFDAYPGRIEVEPADPPTPPEVLCRCGHHLIAHEGNKYEGHCRGCNCLRFDPSIEATAAQGTE